MRNAREYKLLYVVAIIMVVTISTMGSTYAYFAARTSSDDSTLNTGSTTYSISMDINPIYSGFSFIPMNDVDALKGIKNECHDKYNRGVCSAYSIRVYGYSSNLDFVSGYMNVDTNNIENLSYMMFENSDTYDEDNCFEYNGEYYCKVVPATHVVEEENLSLGDSYDVRNKSETKIILLIWLSNLNRSQNENDIGNFNASITMQAGNGGEIKGSIASAVVVDDGNEGGSDNGGE